MTGASAAPETEAGGKGGRQMKNRGSADTVQSAYLLEYGRRKIRVCADTFQNLAQIFSEDREDEEEQPERAFFYLKKSLARERRLFAENLKEMAELMNRTSQESVRFLRLGNRRKRQLVRALAGEGMNAEDIYLVQRGNGRMELSLLLSARQTRSRGTRTVQEAADLLSVLLDMRLVPSGRNPFFIGTEPVCCFFEEEPAYVWLTGTARAVRETETVSGDNFAFFEAGDAGLVLALSDGMGSGKAACRDSEAVVDMAESMLEAGIDAQLAVRLMNSAMAGEGSVECLPTLDLCTLDLHEGECTFLKAGAAASFVKHGSVVERVGGASLPLGAMSETQPQPVKRDVSDGDYIILMTDGMTESWPDGEGEKRLETLLSGMNGISPSEMAGLLLRAAIEQRGGRIRDDMTVLCAGIWEKKDGDPEGKERAV